MSTKTTFKRIALVAVASLGFGVLTSVAPASAVENSVTSVTVGTIAPARTGVFTTIPVTFNFAETSTGTVQVAARVLTAPSTSRLANATVNSVNSVAATGSVDLATVLNVQELSSNLAGNDNVATAVDNGNGTYNVQVSDTFTLSSTARTSITLYFALKADVEGSYSLLFSAGGATYAAGLKSATATITTKGAPASIVMTPINSSTTATSGSTGGSLIKVNVLDASGAATTLSSTESLDITDSSASALCYEVGSTDTSIGTEDFIAGTAYIRCYGDAANTASTAAFTNVVTLTGSGTLPATLTTNKTISFAKTTADAGSTFDLDDDAGYAGTKAGGYTTATVSSHVLTLTLAAAASATLSTSYAVKVTDTNGAILGTSWATLAYDVPVTVAAAGTEGSVTVAAALGTSTPLSISIDGPVGGAFTITGDVATIDVVAVDVALIRAAVASTNVIKASVVDEYGDAMPNQTVTVVVTGRNATSGTITRSTDADGYVSYSLADAGTTGNSVVTFSITGGTTNSAATTLIYGDVAVGTVTVTGGATANTVAYPAVGSTTKAITTAVGGAAGSTTTFTATVKDASGNLLSGVPVTWTVDKATAGITKSATSDAAACVTGTAGTCTTTVFSWAAPSKVTVTATAGGKTGTGYENFVNAASDARVLSATVSGSLAVAKVVDRYGNPVAGVTVSAKTSVGYFGSGATSTTGVTTEDGTVGFALTGAGTVTLSVDSATYTQTDDAADKVGTTAVTAAVAGTTTGVGASFAPAGVNSVAVEVTQGADSAAQAAADAAAEATDAANAATDAANAAAEAADAATAAAQDAADAVAALSTQVSEMVNALKKQITALTNLVIKIQKKVRA